MKDDLNASCPKDKLKDDLNASHPDDKMKDEHNFLKNDDNAGAFPFLDSEASFSPESPYKQSAMSSPELSYALQLNESLYAPTCIWKKNHLVVTKQGFILMVNCQQGGVVLVVRVRCHKWCE